MDPFYFYMALMVSAFVIFFIHMTTDWAGGVRRWLNHIKYGGRTVATKSDYSPNARLLGNGMYFTGKYDFLVAVCPRCGNNSEHDGCFICGKHNVYATRKFSIFSWRKRMLSCRDCWDNTNWAIRIIPVLWDIAWYVKQ